MKLSLTIHDKTFSIESNEGYDGSNLDELTEQFKGLLVKQHFGAINRIRANLVTHRHFSSYIYCEWRA